MYTCVVNKPGKSVSQATALPLYIIPLWAYQLVTHEYKIGCVFWFWLITDLFFWKVRMTMDAWMCWLYIQEPPRSFVHLLFVKYRYSSLSTSMYVSPCEPQCQLDSGDIQCYTAFPVSEMTIAASPLQSAPCVCSRLQLCGCWCYKHNKVRQTPCWPGSYTQETPRNII